MVPEEAAYRVTLETPMNIDRVALRCSVPATLLGASKQAEGNMLPPFPDCADTALPHSLQTWSRAARCWPPHRRTLTTATRCSPRSGPPIHPPASSSRHAPAAPLRLRAAAHTASLRQLRAVEGQYGTLTAAVIAAVHPRTARLVSLPIKPLSLHHRCACPPPAALSPH